eukprot:m.62317 g.62317  ORF g.62317 m.62317 type:complete len:58 (+) comp35054_c0_seq7:769-942(+)
MVKWHYKEISTQLSLCDKLRHLIKSFRMSVYNSRLSEMEFNLLFSRFSVLIFVISCG